MSIRPNILFLMSDQHNAGTLGIAGHPNVKTPTLDGIAARGIRFTHAYCNNPICSPSRLSFVTGQYPHTHGYLGNNNFEENQRNPDTLGAVLRRYGYQTALIGKGHMIARWDEEAYEHIRYCDLCDADRNDLTRHHYFKYLLDHGLADRYEDGTLPPDHEASRKGCAIADLPYEHSIEHWTGEESLSFLRTRDRRRPFFLHMSFERPHPNWCPSADHAGMYDPADIQLGPDYVDWWENRWAGRPEFIRRLIHNRMSRYTAADFKRVLAYHFALVTVIDMEMGRVVDYLRETGDLDRTIVVYVADHGDFAGDHGVCDKNLGIYESIHRIPFLLSFPGGPRGEVRDEIVESVDLLPTLCELAETPLPPSLDGRSLVPLLEKGRWAKHEALCEWDFPAPQRFVTALRTERYRLVFYSHALGGELYDHADDPYEMHNRWDDPAYQQVRLELLERLFDRVNAYARKTDFDTDAVRSHEDRFTLRELIQKKCRKWSDLQRVGRA